VMGHEKENALTAPTPSREHQASHTEMGRLLEQAILSLPCHYRAVLICGTSKR
jgi:hypothetical protein